MTEKLAELERLKKEYKESWPAGIGRFEEMNDADYEKCWGLRKEIIALEREIELSRPPEFDGEKLTEAILRFSSPNAETEASRYVGILISASEKGRKLTESEFNTIMEGAKNA